MTTSLIVGAVIIVVALFFIFRSGRKDSSRLDDLHITAEGKNRDK